MNRTIHNSALMYWTQGNFCESYNNGGGKVIIPSLSNEPVRVVFENLKDKEKCTGNIELPDNIQWQDIVYTVDVQPVLINNIIRQYRIVKVYDEIEKVEI